MVIEQMRVKMNNIIELRNHLVFVERCFYNLDSGKYQIKTFKNISHQNLGDGVFVTVEKNLYALYKFCQEEIDKFKRICRFVFWNDGKEIVNFIYEKPTEDWSFWDIDMDFFHWLVSFSHSTELINRWTK